MTINFQDSAYGLITDNQRHVNRMLQDYDRNLSLRRIPERDPAFTPQKPFGVWEDGIKTDALSNWVFTLSEWSIDDRVMARIVENDMVRQGADAKVAKWQAFEKASRVSALKTRADEMAEREDEMTTLGRMARGKTSIRTKIHGEDMIIGDTLRPVRTRIL